LCDGDSAISANVSRGGDKDNNDGGGVGGAARARKVVATGRDAYHVFQRFDDDETCLLPRVQPQEAYSISEAESGTSSSTAINVDEDDDIHVKTEPKPSDRARSSRRSQMHAGERRKGKRKGSNTSSGGDMKRRVGVKRER
jgi:hypothetical protein